MILSQVIWNQVGSFKNHDPLVERPSALAPPARRILPDIVILKGSPTFGAETYRPVNKHATPNLRSLDLRRKIRFLGRQPDFKDGPIYRNCQQQATPQCHTSHLLITHRVIGGYPPIMPDVAGIARADFL
jgi:hypothetical protein